MKNIMITSLQNERVKQFKKLHNKKERKKTNTFIVEGFHLVEETHNSNLVIKEIIIKNIIEVPDMLEVYPITRVSNAVFNHISQTQSPQGIAAIVKMTQPRGSLSDKVLMVDGIQDPGNLGTIIRTADAAGFASIILGDKTVDMFNDKAVRATQGSLFHVLVRYQNLQEAISKLQRDGYSIWASALRNANIYNQVEPPEKLALIVGNEGSGIQDHILDLADELIYIPIHGKAESLNVSIAAGVLMYYINS